MKSLGAPQRSSSRLKFSKGLVVKTPPKSHNIASSFPFGTCSIYIILLCALELRFYTSLTDDIEIN